MRVLILHDRVPADAPPDARDSLEQARAIAGTLRAAGHLVRRLAVTLNLAALERQLRADPPDAVFNLVEAPDGQGRLLHLAPAVVEAAGIPCTGTGSATLHLTADKVAVKHRLRAQRLPTPVWIDTPSAAADHPGVERWIVKSVWEHASIGLDDQAVIPAGEPARLAARWQWLEGRHGRAYAEAFIPGREFNLALLADGDGVQLLPPAEIVFIDYPDDRPHIVGYEAKWQARSFAGTHTPRRFAFPAADRPLLRRLARLARHCWQHFHLAGYARVDFRVDAAGNPWILEINPNPCLAPDAGFIAAAERAGLSPKDVAERLLAAAHDNRHDR